MQCYRQEGRIPEVCKGNFFGIDFDVSAIYTDTTDAWDEDELFAGVGGWSGRVRGSSEEEDSDDTLILV